jgi:hypothetical protein
MTPHLLPTNMASLETALESAVVLSWKELLRPRDRGVVLLECATAPERCLRYLKIWLSTQAGCDLICEYWASAGIPACGVTFSNGYQSILLTEMLENLLQHHEGSADFLSGETILNVIVIAPPSTEDTTKATASMTEAYRRLGLTFGKLPAMAA